MYSTSPKIFWLVSTLFGLKTTDNLYEFEYLYPNQTFSKFPQQNVFFTIFVRLLWNLVENWQLLLTQPTFLTFLTYLTYLTYPTYLTYLTHLTYLTYLTYLTSLQISLKHRALISQLAATITYKMWGTELSFLWYHSTQ